MNRKHLDNVEFKKKVTLKEPEYQKEEEVNKDPDRFARIFAKVMKLVFFLIVVVALIYSGLYFAGSFTSFCRGEKYKPVSGHVETYKEENR